MGSEHSFVHFSLTSRRCNDKHSITIHLSLLSPLHVTILHNFPRLVFCKHARFRRRYFLPLLQSNSRSTPDSFSSLPLARTYTNSLWKERRGNTERELRRRGEGGEGTNEPFFAAVFMMMIPVGSLADTRTHVCTLYSRLPEGDPQTGRGHTRVTLPHSPPSFSPSFPPHTCFILGEWGDRSALPSPLDYRLHSPSKLALAHTRGGRNVN